VRGLIDVRIGLMNASSGEVDTAYLRAASSEARAG
jgi:hypothetical protein